MAGLIAGARTIGGKALCRRFLCLALFRFFRRRGRNSVLEQLVRRLQYFHRADMVAVLAQAFRQRL